MQGLADGKARQIYLVLRDRITSGALTRGAKLPPEPILADTHGVARITVRRALARLAAEGLVERRRSSGTRVIYQRNSPAVTADIANVLAALVEMGRRTGVRLLAFEYVVPPAPIGEALKLAPLERTQHAIRVRLVDGAPFSYLTTHVPERIGVGYSDADLAIQPLLTLLERSGISAERATQTIGAALATPEVAAALQVDVGAPLIELTRVVFDKAGGGVEYLHAFYRPDRYSFRMDLVRSHAEGLGEWSPIGRDVPPAPVRQEPEINRKINPKSNSKRNPKTTTKTKRNSKSMSAMPR